MLIIKSYTDMKQMLNFHVASQNVNVNSQNTILSKLMFFGITRDHLVILMIRRARLFCNNRDCQQFTDMNNVLSHLRSHLAKGELVRCPFEKCDKNFSLRSSFTAHVSRNHRTSTFAQLRIMDTLSEHPSSAFFDVTEDEVDESEFTDSLTKCNAKPLYIKKISACFICYKPNTWCHRQPFR